MIVVVVVDGQRWLCSVVVVVNGDSGCVWRVAVMVVYGGGGGGW